MEAVIMQLVNEVKELRYEVSCLRREQAMRESVRGMMSIAEACEYLHISRTTMNKRMNEGDISFFVKKGGRVLFPADKLRDYASGLTV